MTEQAIVLTALAGMLHDIGKFAQRAGRAGSHAESAAQVVDEFSDLFPLAWHDDLRDAVGNHHKPGARKEIERITRVADWLAAGERHEGVMAQSKPGETPLRPVMADVDIGRKMSGGVWGYGLSALALQREVLFPTATTAVNEETYAALWTKFAEQTRRLAGLGPIDSAPRLLSLAMLLQRFTWCIPSATPWEDDEEHRTLPDISLYDHLKVTAAIATCLYFMLPEDLDALHRRESAANEKPVAWMLRADFSGIQDFIYRIAATRVDGTYRGAAKRLRGRSFYLALLGEVVADWFVRELGLTAANILFSGGGRFDLLLPLKAGEKLPELERQVQGWLLKEFHGELGLQIAVESVKPRDFADLCRVYAALEDALASKKLRKWEGFVRGGWIEAEKFYAPQEALYHTCSACHLTPRGEPGICAMCQVHLRLGEKLPKSEYLATLYGEAGKSTPEGAAAIEFGEPFRVTAALLDKEEAKLLLRLLKGDGVQAVLYRLNETDFLRDDAPRSVSLGFRFLANAAPVGADGEVMDFEEIAKLSEGAQLLGVLKADVDHLGLIFGEGLRREASSDRPWTTTPTISRVSTLSHSLDLFFAGWLGKICEQVGKLYVVYSGGDDLLILGPWDQILELAQRLNEDLREYACRNENITLSAGIVLVKPHFPIQRFAPLAGEALEKAKNAGRNRVTVFDETVEWAGEEGSFAQLMEFGKALAERVERDEMPKGFVYFLKALHDQHFDEERENPMWVPKYHYSLARRLSEEVIADPKLTLTMDMPERMRYIRIPVSYVSLKTRKE